MIREILLLGNPRLYEQCNEVTKDDLPEMKRVVNDLHDTLLEFRRRYGAGRAIAAPQIGVMKRLVYMYIDTPVVFINPVVKPDGDEMMEVMDDCMSFPELYVKLMRHKRITIDSLDIEFNPQKHSFEGDLAELLQHECDHLDGVLATMRALDNKAFFARGYEKV